MTSSNERNIFKLNERQNNADKKKLKYVKDTADADHKGENCFLSASPRLAAIVNATWCIDFYETLVLTIISTEQKIFRSSPN